MAKELGIRLECTCQKIAILNNASSAGDETSARYGEYVHSLKGFGFANALGIKLVEGCLTYLIYINARLLELFIIRPDCTCTLYNHYMT